MNNLPLQPLVWDWSYGDGGKTNAVCRAKSPSHEYIIRLEAGGDCYVDYRKFDNDEDSDNRKDEPPAFDSIKAAQEWAQFTHYPSKMQPYVKPMPTWIDVNERLPNELKTVLITYEAGLNFKLRKFMALALREGGDWLGIDDMFGGYVFDDEYNADKFNDDLHGFNITHWMPIPEFSNMQNLHKGE